MLPHFRASLLVKSKGAMWCPQSSSRVGTDRPVALPLRAVALRALVVGPDHRARASRDASSSGGAGGMAMGCPGASSFHLGEKVLMYSATARRFQSPSDLPGRHVGVVDADPQRAHQVRVGGERPARRRAALEDARGEVPGHRIEPLGGVPVAVALRSVAADAEALVERLAAVGEALVDGDRRAASPPWSAPERSASAAMPRGATRTGRSGAMRVVPPVRTRSRCRRAPCCPSAACPTRWWRPGYPRAPG